ncbi:MAG: hypothetical protein ACREBS_09540 [Nitrososphaerales archaeon]
MVRKIIVLAAAFVFAAIALTSAGGLVASAFQPPPHASMVTTSLSPTLCASDCLRGTQVNDTATLSVTPETCSPAPSPPCAYGSVVFKVFPDKSCNTEPTGNPAFASTVSVPSTLASGSASVTSGTLSTTALPPGNYVWIVSYVSGGGANSWPSSLQTCEQMILTSPSNGVPEFSLGSLGILAVLGMTIPLLLMMRSSFVKNIAV